MSIEDLQRLIRIFGEDAKIMDVMATLTLIDEMGMILQAKK